MRKHTARKMLDPWGWITKRIPLADDQQRDLGIAYHASLQALLQGHGTEQAWSTLACTLNIAMILCEQGHSPAAMPTIQLAQEALMRAKDRAQRLGKWALDGDGIRVICAAVNLHDEQISRVTRGQITEALNMVKTRAEAGEVMA